MKVNIVKEEAIEYPKLVIYEPNKSIILLTDEKTGTVVFPGKSSNLLGQFETCWSDVDRKDFTGILELSN